MRPFAYERPESIEAAVRLLEDAGPDAMLLAGGTDVVVGLRDGSVSPRVVVDLKHVDVFGGRTIEVIDGFVRFGALAVMRDIEAHPIVLDQLPALAEAARVVGSVQIRHRATLVGNICNGSPAADTTPALLVYAAFVVIDGPAGQRRVSLDDFVVGPGSTGLERGELVSAIEVPIPKPGLGAAYTRLVRRRGTDLASVTMCASVDDVGGVRLSYGSVGPRAFLVNDEGGVLGDASAPADDRSEILERLLSQASPSVTSIRAGPDYRLAMLRVLARRALGAAIARRTPEAA